MRNLTHDINDLLGFLRRVIRAAPDPIIVLDEDGRAIMMNDQAQGVFDGWLEGSTPNFQEMAMAAHCTVEAGRCELHHPSGRIFLIARGPFSGGRKGEINTSGQIVALRDITESRERENSRERFLAFLSHDLRTPQVAIMGLAERMIVKEQNANLLERIIQQSARALKLADDFVQLARIQETPTKLVDVDLVFMIDEASDRFYSQAHTKNIVVERGGPEEPVFINADPDLLGRMLDNLLGNAIKYSPQNSRIAMVLTLSDLGVATVSIADEGPGLPPERVSNPFAPFGAHETGSGPSAGLGLAFVESVAAKHGWTITVQTEIGKGTCFTIEIPEA